MDKRYLSPKELANMLNVDITTVYGWTSGRQIPYTKIGRLVRFDSVKIDNWLKQKSIPCIKDLEKILGIGRTTIFYWESRNKIPRAHRTPMGNYRWWTLGELKEIKKIIEGGR